MHLGHAPREGSTDLLVSGEPAAAVRECRALLEVLPRIPQAPPGWPLERECSAWQLPKSFPWQGCMGWWDMLMGWCPPRRQSWVGTGTRTLPTHSARNPLCYKPWCQPVPSSARANCLVQGIDIRAGAISRDPPAHVQIGKLRHPEAGDSDTVGRLQGWEQIKIPHS